MKVVENNMSSNRKSLSICMPIMVEHGLCANTPLAEEGNWRLLLCSNLSARVHIVGGIYMLVRHCFGGFYVI